MWRQGLASMPRVIQEATDAFRDVSWPLTPFVNEDCVVGGEARVSVRDFNQGYQRHCERNGILKRLGWKRVLRLMEGRYAVVAVDEIHDGKRVREKQYVGIGLREPVVTSM